MSQLEEILKKDCYNFISPFGLGDTMMLCGFKKAFEARNSGGGGIHFIVKPSHEAVMKMYGIQNYTLYSFGTDNASLIKLGKKYTTPQIGKPYIAHPLYIPSAKTLMQKFYRLEVNFKELYALFVNVDVHAFELFRHVPKISASFQKKIAQIAPLQKIILFSPTANSVPALPKALWENAAHKLTQQGFQIISNVFEESDCIPGTHFVPMTMEEVVALAYRCHSVYSVRSGLCDLLALSKNLLTVFYDQSSTLKIYGLKTLFHRKKTVEEIVDKSSEYFQPLVTVVTVTYNLIKNNRKRMIEKCIDSVHRQTYPHIEHLIIDGDSTDGTQKFLQSFEKKGQIKIFSEKDTGIYDAMNKGIRYAKGKYIAFLNSDDFYHNENAVLQSVHQLEAHGADFSFGTVKCVSADSNAVQIFYPCTKLVMAEMPFSHQSLFVRRDILKKRPFDVSYKYAADYDFILNLYLTGCKGVQVDAEIATYCTDGLSGTHYEECVAEYKRVYAKNYSFLNQKYYDDMIRRKKIPQKLIKFFQQKCPVLFESKIKKFFVCGFPFLSIREANDIKSYRLFGLIPFLVVEQSVYRKKIKLFHLTVLKMKRRKDINKVKYYVFGIPVMKVITK